jgi:hypothetical protein
MKEEGPLLETLTRRLSECPADFLAEPRIGARGRVHVGAVISDLLTAALSMQRFSCTCV